MTEGLQSADEPNGPELPDGAPTRLSRIADFWRSPAGQPAWARPALLVVAALAAFTYAWGINGAYLEPFYAGAARSMAESWHNFVFGAADPWGTVSVDKLPGALWFQALSVRLFGAQVWAVVLPQAIEGILTVLVLYRVVRRVAGVGAGLLAAVVVATSPIVILLDHGNISDSLLILLLVLAADATTRAYLSGRLRSLLWAGALVGLAFQTKMLEAWLVLPAFYLAYLVAAPVASALRRVLHATLSALVVVVVSLSWMTAVSALPSADRPYADGSCNDSVFSQVFAYNGFKRAGHSLLAGSPGCHRQSAAIVAIAHDAARAGITLGAIGPGWDRLISGALGRDDAWLLLPAVASALGLLLWRRGRPRTDPWRAAVLLWSTWLVVIFAFFSAGRFVNSYYTAALLPPVAALCGMGGVAAWAHRRSAGVRLALAGVTVASVTVTVALVPGAAGVHDWVVVSTLVVGAAAVGILLVSLRPRHDSVWSTAVGPVLAAMAMLLGTSWAAGVVVSAGLGPFDTPYESTFVTTYSQQLAASYPRDAHLLAEFVRGLPPGVAADVVETSGAAGQAIFATGREFLPVGGFSGEAPVPPLSEFVRLVAEGKIGRVTVATSPPTRDPDLLWVRAHCQSDPARSYRDGLDLVTYGVFNCMRPTAGTPVPGGVGPG